MAEYVLDYLELPSADNRRSREFFAQAFGWTHVDYGDSYAEIRGAGLLFGVNSDGGDRSVAPMPVIRATDLDAAQSAVIAAGGVVTREQYDFPGGRRFFCREPGGTELAIYVTRDEP
ncbi:MAG TPA: VOC family protein [Devosia sp.]|nr:VOC family protein [Devosia sp.]